MKIFYRTPNKVFFLCWLILRQCHGFVTFFYLCIHYAHAFTASKHNGLWVTHSNTCTHSDIINCLKGNDGPYGGHIDLIITQLIDWRHCSRLIMHRQTHTYAWTHRSVIRMRKKQQSLEVYHSLNIHQCLMKALNMID